MSRVHFANSIRLDLDDRTLAHLHRAMLVKLRRGESFHLSWHDDTSIGNGRTTIWVGPDTSMVWHLTGPAQSIDPLWVEQLVTAANGPNGMTLLPDPTHGER